MTGFPLWDRQRAASAPMLNAIAEAVARRYRVVSGLFLLLLVMAPSAASAQSCPVNTKEVQTALYEENFGTGPRVSHPAILNHNYQASGNVPDDWYAVHTSAGFSAAYLRTVGDVDADGNTTGRYAGINMRGKNQGGWTGEFFRIDDIPMVAGDFLRFSTAAVGTCLNCPDTPNFSIRLYNSADNSLIASYSSSAQGVANNDLWVVIRDEISFPAGVPNVDLVLFNDQPTGGNGNDVGIDNIFFYSIACAPLVADLAITKTNTPGMNNNIDQTNDILISGSATNYTIVVTNNGPDTLTGMVVTDSPGSGLACSAGDPVTITGNGVPSGSFTIADLTGLGITLGALAIGEATTISYSCTVN